MEVSNKIATVSKLPVSITLNNQLLWVFSPCFINCPGFSSSSLVLVLSTQRPGFFSSSSPVLVLSTTLPSSPVPVQSLFYQLPWLLQSSPCFINCPAFFSSSSPVLVLSTALPSSPVPVQSLFYQLPCLLLQFQSSPCFINCHGFFSSSSPVLVLSTALASSPLTIIIISLTGTCLRPDRLLTSLKPNCHSHLQLEFAGSTTSASFQDAKLCHKRHGVWAPSLLTAFQHEESEGLAW